MTNVLERAMEAANQYRPTNAKLTLVGKDGALMVCRFGNPNIGWLLGFVVPVVANNMLNVSTIKYVCRMGITQSTKCYADSGIYDLMDILRTDLVDKETLTFQESQERMRFADFVVATHSTTNTDYSLTQGDIEEYHERNNVIETSTV